MSKPMAIAMMSTGSGWPNKPPVGVLWTVILVSLELKQDCMQVGHAQDDNFTANLMASNMKRMVDDYNPMNIHLNFTAEEWE